MQKAFNIVRTILVWIVVLFAVAMTVFTVFSVTTLNRYDRSLFGYKMFIVTSDSMEATDFKSGDLIFVKEVDPKTLKQGDIITFISKDENSLGETLTHKIRTVTADAKGNLGFVTYGTTTNTDDESLVLYTEVLGKYESHIAGLGTVFNFLKTTQGFFLCIFTPIMLVIIYEIINFFVLLRKSKKIQVEEIHTEKERLEAEREANAQMMTELLVLKAQLEEKQLALSSASRPSQTLSTAVSVHRVTPKKVSGKKFVSKKR